MKGYLRKEKIKVQVLNTEQEVEHFHQDVELLYILEGTLDVHIDKNVSKLEAGDLLVINSNKKHACQAIGSVLFCKLMIEYEMVSDIFQSGDIIFWCDSTKENNEAIKRLRTLLDKMLDHYLSVQGGAASFGHISLCYAILEVLSTNFLVRNTGWEGNAEKKKFQNRIWQIENYIRINYTQPISLKDLSEKLFLSNGYLSRFFKSHYGMSFADYLSNVRLYHAVDELLYTDLPITRIAYDNGFANVAAFNKIMQRTYNETPTALRKRSKEDMRIEANQHDDAVDKTIVERKLAEVLRNKKRDRDDAKGAEEDKDVLLRVEADVKQTEIRKAGWQELVNGGAAADLLRYEVREHIMRLKEIMHFKYVRFWNIFSEQLLLNIHRSDGRYNFSRLDGILDFLVQADLKPHIELGQKPRRIQKNVRNNAVEDELEDFFVHQEEWRNFLDVFIRHLVRRYGSREVDTWRVEIWYDERYENIATSLGGYFEVFNIAYESIRKVAKEIEIGGCGIRVDFNSELGTEFLEEWSKQRVTPDFISMLYFAYDRGEENDSYYSKRSTDGSGLLHKIKRLRYNMAIAGLGNKKLYVTEWNMSISERNYLNDTCFKGAYIVRNLLETYDEADSFGYFQATDRVSEYYDSNELLYGGNGLLSKDTILKPAGFAFDFLGRLGPYLVQQSGDCMITTDRNDSYGIICHNAKKLNYNYYLIDEDKVKKEHITRYFEEHEDKVFAILLRGMENGNYKIKLHRVNEQSASILHIWGEMNYDNDLSKNDIRYFQRVCEPKLTIKKVKVSDEKMLLRFSLAENEIVFIKIRRVE